MVAYPALVGVARAAGAGASSPGTEVNGNKNWLDFGGPFRIQPSELAKLALVLWGADLLARKERLLGQWRHLLVPLVPVGGFVILGWSCSAATSARRSSSRRSSLALLWVAGAPIRLFVLRRGAGRAGRHLHGQHPVDADVADHRVAAPRPGRPARQRAAGAARQVRPRPRAAGGASASAAPGEVGRPARGAHRLHLRDHRRGARPGRHPRGARRCSASSATPGCGSPLEATEPFVRLAAGGDHRLDRWCRRWSTSARCSALLPITGVPLPLVSYGGSALVPTMLGLGMLLSFARPRGVRRRRSRCCGGWRVRAAAR